MGIRLFGVPYFDAETVNDHDSLTIATEVTVEGGRLTEQEQI